MAENDTKKVPKNLNKIACVPSGNCAIVAPQTQNPVYKGQK